MTQFAFLQSEFPDLFNFAKRVENAALSDPRGACAAARLTLEVAVEWMYEVDNSLCAPYDSNLSSLIHEASFRRLVGNTILTKVKLIKDYGNDAAHNKRDIPESRGIAVARELFHFTYWLARNYGSGQIDPAIQFDPSKLEKTTALKQSTIKQVMELSKKHEDQKLELNKARAAAAKNQAAREAIEAETKALRAEIALLKKANNAKPDTHDYNEAQTRLDLIDKDLRAMGWPLDQPRDREYEVSGMPSQSGQGFVDYVLWGDNGKPLAIIEAKRTSRDATSGKQQAKLYADCLEAQFNQRPLIYYTNGFDIWLWDDVLYPPRNVQGYMNKSQMSLAIQRRTTRLSLVDMKVDENIAGRYYQTRAINRVAESFEQDHLRKALLVMATGSGKTRTAVALSDILMKANWAKRVLFLADRVSLVKQAHNAFKTHLPSSPSANLQQNHGEKNDHKSARICFSTHQSMMGEIQKIENGNRKFGVGHFDLIIIDEAHRSIYRKYKAIFEYFDCFLVGLTATPREEIDRQTYGLFDLEKGVPTDKYELDQAVADGYLVPPKAISVQSNFMRDGISYDKLSDEEKEQWDDIEWNDEGITPDRVEANAVNKSLFNTVTVDKVIAQLMREGIHIDEGDKLGKTIIFAKSSKHADYIVERFDINFPHYNGKFAQKIDHAVSHAQSLIDDFSDPKKMPQIAVSVDMLDTGIDVPEVVNLVFFKIVRSKTKFLQMIGRGTRLSENLFGPGDHKKIFQILDYCKNFEFFNAQIDTSDGPTSIPLSEKLFVTRLEIITEIDARDDKSESETRLRQTICTRLIDEVQSMQFENFIIRPFWQYVEKFHAAKAWDTLSLEDKLNLQEHVAKLPNAIENDHVSARRFDLHILTCQLAVLRGDTFVKTQETIMKIGSLLETIETPQVKAQLDLILDIQTAAFWEDITLPMLEEVRLKLRLLINSIKFAQQKIVYTDFEDEFGDASIVEIQDASIGVNQVAFKKKMQHFLKQHENHLSLLKLRRNEQLTPNDIAALDQIFLNEGIEVNQDFKNHGGIGLFIRSLIGMDRKAAKEAFGTFLDDKILSSSQIEFINMIVDYLTRNGSIETTALYESPFTDLNAHGPSGVFQDAEVIELFSILDQVKNNAIY